MSETYTALAAHFSEHFSDVRGGVRLEYLTGEQVISRLNDVLGPGGWCFDVREHGLNQESDEYWVLAELQAQIDGVTVKRAQFGSQKVKRSRSTGQPLDIGFDLKGATTDALKKCATLIGVGLYLSEKNGGIPQDEAEHAAPPPPKPQQPKPQQQAAPVSNNIRGAYIALFNRATGLGITFSDTDPWWYVDETTPIETVKLKGARLKELVAEASKPAPKAVA